MAFQVEQTFNKMFDTIEQKGQALENMINKAGEGEMSNEQLLKIQFNMGMYQSMVETLSTVTKAQTDSWKSLAQRAN